MRVAESWKQPLMYLEGLHKFYGRILFSEELAGHSRLNRAENAKDI